MNNFRDDELVTVQGRTFPVVGGRLRLVHEANQHLAIKTELVKVEVDQVVVVRATVTAEKGEFTGTGVASAARDARLADALVELAETRAVARALRFAGYGVETCGVEELGDAPVLETHSVPSARQALRVVPGKASGTASGPGSNGNGKGNGDGHGGNGNGSHVSPRSVATAAQLRAIRTLARQAGTSPEGVCREHYGHTRVEELSVRDASGLIDALKNGRETNRPVA
ncbi:MAG: hypothetical protein HYY25_01070 [Candidatus Wallbacteria bacterium]|nr:hypothetical protein [Candidatus Wallbacteria bacterium]